MLLTVVSLIIQLIEVYRNNNAQWLLDHIHAIKTAMFLLLLLNNSWA
jgi:DNA integrity scanning protein DisA with diadenylate cyclase activity